MNVKISIVMTTYNSSAYLDECIQSVLNQSFKNFEFIIVDDGSTDSSVGIIEQYKDNRIRLFKNPHNFVESLNTGMQIATGKYIARMDSDDIMVGHRLDTQYDYMEAHPEISVCGSWIKTFGLEEKVYALPENNEMLISNMLTGNPLCNPSVMIRKQCLDRLFKNNSKIYHPAFRYAEDYKLWCDLVMDGAKISNIQEVLLYYRCSAQQITAQHAKEMEKLSKKIQATYFTYVTHKLAQQNPAYYEVINAIIKLCNKNILSFRHALQVVKPIYINHLTHSI